MPRIHHRFCMNDSLTIMHAIFTSGIAGSERYCIDLANCQARLGHDVHVVGSPHSEVRLELDPAVKYHAMQKSILRRLNMGRLAMQLQLDVFHGHLRDGCKAGLWLRKSVAKISTLHLGYKPRHHKRMDGLICINPSQSDALQDTGHTFRLVPNWLPTASPYAEQCAGLRMDLSIAPETFVVGTVARLVECKGVRYLIEAFKSSAAANAALVLIGSGDEEPALRELAGSDERIHFCGYRSDVRQVLSEFDLFVSSSLEEPFGLAILEAMDARLPIVATDTEGARFLLSDRADRLVAPGDAQALGTEIKRVMDSVMTHGSDQPTYELLGFSQNENVRAVLEFYRAVLSSVRKDQ